jgi:AcrR family transcriptional regulator
MVGEGGGPTNPRRRSPRRNARSPGGRPGRPRSDTRGRLLDAAEKLLADVGTMAVSMRAVAEQAGVTKALVFYYFPTKEALVDAVLERYYAAHAAVLTAPLRADAPLRERAAWMVEAYFEFMHQHRHFPRLVQVELSRGSEGVAHLRRYFGGLYEAVAGALAPDLPAAGPLAARQFFIDFSGLVTNYFVYAPLIAPFWSSEPLGAAAREERRQHLLWLVDAMVARLERPTAAATSSTRRTRRGRS